MDKEAVIERLKKDLDLPNFKGRLEEKEYTEEEYQKIKKDLNDYFENYVRNIENQEYKEAAEFKIWPLLLLIYIISLAQIIFASKSRTDSYFLLKDSFFLQKK